MSVAQHENAIWVDLLKLRISSINNNRKSVYICAAFCTCSFYGWIITLSMLLPFSQHNFQCMYSVKDSDGELLCLLLTTTTTTTTTTTRSTQMSQFFVKCTISAYQRPWSWHSQINAQVGNSQLTEQDFRTSLHYPYHESHQKHFGWHGANQLTCNSSLILTRK